MAEDRITVLNVEDEEVDHLALTRMVERKGLHYDVKWAPTFKDALEQLEGGGIDVILIDYNLPDGSGLDVLERAGDIPAIFLTGSGDEMVAVKAMKAGAYDYVIKDPDGRYLDLIPYAIEHALERHREKERFRKYVDEIERMNRLMLDREKRMAELRAEIKRLREEKSTKHS